jgi:hypothetical protein
MAEMQHKHNNQPPNWIEEESKSLGCEQQRKGVQKHNNPPKEIQNYFVILDMHNSKTKSYYSMKLFNVVDNNVN